MFKDANGEFMTSKLFESLSLEAKFQAAFPELNE
jgi:hypothetical protein